MKLAYRKLAYRKLAKRDLDRASEQVETSHGIAAYFSVIKTVIVRVIGSTLIRSLVYP